MFQRVTFDKQVSVEYFEVESDWDSTCDQEWNDYLRALLDQGNYSVFDLHNHSLYHSLSSAPISDIFQSIIQSTSPSAT